MPGSYLICRLSVYEGKQWLLECILTSLHATQTCGRTHTHTHTHTHTLAQADTHMHMQIHTHTHRQTHTHTHTHTHYQLAVAITTFPPTNRHP